MTESKEAKYTTYTFIAKRHGLTVPKLKQILAASGYLLDDQATSLAIKIGIAKIVPLDPDSNKYETGRTEFPTWDLERVEALIRKMGASKDLRSVPRGISDVRRCTSAYVACVTGAMGLKGWEGFYDSRFTAISPLRSQLSFLNNDGMSMTVSLVGFSVARVIQDLETCDAWLKRRRKIVDQKSYDDAFMISIGIRNYLAKRR